MRYCTHCGAQVHEEAVICVTCGCSLERKNMAVVLNDSTDDILQTVIKVFLILGCISQGWLLIPLAWCLPITISIFNRMRDKKPIGTGLKICTLLFINLIAGVCLLCMKDE